jgi:hypothetical protein
MIGILPEAARVAYEIPDGYEPWTALAIGYVGDPASLPETIRQRDLALRQRKPLDHFVFSGKWGNASPVVKK